ncbi:MAG: DUF805 domain-containing protein [Prevotella sp.]|nr:DUF805 domain-containing protein [Prevotella sp.]MBQ9204649.1 DUF805 domain-containing protein [Prevotella sp.]
MNALPSLGFTEAIKTVAQRMNDFKGRSRRSEFWWWMLLIFLLKQVAGAFVTDAVASVFVDTICMLGALAVTVRRLHDVNKSGLWVYVSYATGFVTLFLMAKSGYVDFILKMTQKGTFSNAKLEQFISSMPQWGVETFSIASLVWMVTSLAVIGFCLMDSKPESNKYGKSPKYV